jgi:hypothetical protein
MDNLLIPSISGIKNLIEPIDYRLQRIENLLQKQPKSNNSKKYYRNNDLKELFGLSNNTIIKYRENGTLPYTRMGDVYLYEAKEIHDILEKNRVCL